MMMVTYQEAMQNVKARVTASRTSFRAGMAILPPERRDGMYALYAFCREVDDIADESPTPLLSAEGLQAWRERISKLFRGEVTDPITAALSHCIPRFGLIEADFQAIIDGMEMDAGAPICAPTQAMLDLYCDRVASAVGRVSVRIFGDSSPKAMEVAYYLGRALQTTNILRDIAEDAARSRVYLPAELLDRHGITTRVPAEIIAHPKLRDVCRDLADVARSYFLSADAAMNACIPSAMKPARIMRAYYGAIFSRLVAADWRDPNFRIRLPKWQKLWLMLRHVAG